MMQKFLFIDISEEIVYRLIAMLGTYQVICFSCFLIVLWLTFEVSKYLLVFMWRYFLII